MVGALSNLHFWQEMDPAELTGDVILATGSSIGLGLGLANPKPLTLTLTLTLAIIGL